MYTYATHTLGQLTGIGLLALALAVAPIPEVSPDGPLTVANDAQAQGAGQGPGPIGSGGPGGSGNTGTGTGPGPINRNNFGGGGGGGGGTVPSAVAPTLPNAASGGAGAYSARVTTALEGGWCVDVPGPGQKKGDRVSGKNLMRLDAVRATIAPNYNTLWKSPLYIAADYQAELEKKKPDTVLAGTYLGMVSSVPVTVEAVNEVNALLCVTATPEVAEQIATTAEAQRKSLNR